MDIRDWSEDQLQAEYQEKYPLYEKLCSELAIQLNELISEAGISIAFPIESRVKTWDSIKEKCERNHLSPKGLKEIADVAGLRIILLFKQDISKVCDKLEQNFEIVRKENTLQRLAADQFGYGSIHYELAPPNSWLNVPTLRRLNGLQCEVQIRTASQHIWAAASHILQYKRESDVPIPFRRSINRVAALLETVDLEFERVLQERGAYIEKIENINESEFLNTDSLRNLLNRNFPENNKVIEENYAEILEELRTLDINTVKELEDIIKRNWDKVSKEEAKKVYSSQKALESGEENLGTTKERVLKGVYFTHVGLLRMTLDNEFGDAYR